MKRRDLAKESRVRWLRDALLFKAGYMSAATRKKKRACYLASKVYTYRYLQDSIQKLYRSYETGEAAMYLVNYASSYSVTKEKFRSKWFASSKRITFEGQQLPVPSNWDAVLGTTYGAYMELPPRAGAYYGIALSGSGWLCRRASTRTSCLRRRTLARRNTGL